ncbi:cryptochrome DASH [Marinobacterium nitratireducens]|uniref:Cryptochrome DASH n=1 Tax=Marinobacterium nitratireducens TaxID=518897 RepID=A0A918DVS7_9GAMM|nr:DASH family cryptochrome [Marinobacterium nitratireducens]GGO86472.1 cryptochrome DASH [Marinobacterium nitratireducens]
MQLIWLRNDLRLHDQPAFRLAQARREPLAVVYILPEHWLLPDRHGLDRLGAAKARFLRQSLEDLDTQLRRSGLSLRVLCGDPVALLSRWHRRSEFRLITQSAQAPEEAEWLAALAGAGIDIETVENQTLFDAEQIAPLLADWPSSFTAFRHRVEAALEPPQPCAAVALSLTQGSVPLEAPPAWPDFSQTPASAFAGGERAGLEHLDGYLWRRRAIDHYRDSRNQLIGEDFASRLSAWLAWGCLSVREVWHQVRRYEARHGENDQRYWLRFELLWREFFHWSMRHFGQRLFCRDGLAAAPLPAPRFDEMHWRAWRESRTGVPMVDAGLRELVTTGYCSNRMRQNLASYFIHQLGLDWRLGARFFERHLIDFDIASNQGNWAYIAGAGQDPRQGRRFDLNWQLRRYDPALEHIRYWLPELGETDINDILAHQSGLRRLSGYPALLVPVPDIG